MYVLYRVQYRYARIIIVCIRCDETLQDIKTRYHDYMFYFF